jgi:CspA family cold shock protein
MSDPLVSAKEAVMPRGVVKWFDIKKGFGFIRGDGDGKDIFVHHSCIDGEGFKTLRDGEAVEYELVDSEKGPQAHHVRRVESAPSSD